MFPCPHAGTFFTFDDVAIGISFCIDKCYIAFVCLRFFVDQGKDSISSCQSHNDGVELLCHLHKRLCKALGKLQIGRHNTKSDSAYSCNRKYTAENRRQYKLQVSDISDNWSHHITVFICL